jgi:mRNA-degrading endonuclease RelE of RelBE toxin-antitoxin system
MFEWRLRTSAVKMQKVKTICGRLMYEILDENIEIFMKNIEKYRKCSET